MLCLCFILKSLFATRSIVTFAVLGLLKKNGNWDSTGTN